MSRFCFELVDFGFYGNVKNVIDNKRRCIVSAEAKSASIETDYS